VDWRLSCSASFSMIVSYLCFSFAWTVSETSIRTGRWMAEESVNCMLYILLLLYNRGCYILRQCLTDTVFFSDSLTFLCQNMLRRGVFLVVCRVLCAKVVGATSIEGFLVILY